MIMAKEIL